MPASALAGSKRSSTRRRARFSAAARRTLPSRSARVLAARVAARSWPGRSSSRAGSCPVSARIWVSPAAPSIPPGARASGRPALSRNTSPSSRSGFTPAAFAACSTCGRKRFTRCAVATAPPGERSNSSPLTPAAARLESSALRCGVQANGSLNASPRLAPGGVGTTGTSSSATGLSRNATTAQATSTAPTSARRRRSTRPRVARRVPPPVPARAHAHRRRDRAQARYRGARTGRARAPDSSRIRCCASRRSG